ncbi:MAG: hypothetical protein HFJ57_03890 [Clostridia bacterium]|nr:hypothetical protein [Clostridia bacterium]
MMDMEPKCYYEEKKCCYKERKCCVDLILTILLVSFAFVLGLIIGALTGILVLLGLGAFIAVAVILALLIVLRIVTLICCKKQKKCC